MILVPDERDKREQEEANPFAATSMTIGGQTCMRRASWGEKCGRFDAVKQCMMVPGPAAATPAIMPHIVSSIDQVYRYDA